MAGGKIVRIAGGKIIERYENLTYYQDNFTINAGGKIELTTDAEMIYGEPEEPKTGGKYIIRGWWSSDKEGKDKIQKACLGDTVYFQIETRNIPVYDYKNDDKDPDLSRLYVSFYDIQLGWLLGLDFLSLDQKLEGGPEYVYINSKNRACVCLKILNTEAAIKMVKEDDSPGDIEIYCVVEYKPFSRTEGFNSGPVYQKENLPLSFKEYLRVGLPEVPDLYFIKPAVNYQFPEIRSSEGNAIFMQLILNKEDYTQQKLDEAKEKITEKITEQANDAAVKALEKLKKYTYTLAVRELEKGSLTYTDGRVIQRKNVYDTDITMIDGYTRNIKRASNTGFRISDANLQGESHYATTKGLNQLEIFAQSNPIHTAANLGIRVFETLGFVIDLKGIEQNVGNQTLDYQSFGNTLLQKFLSFFPSWVGRLSNTLSIPMALIVNEYSIQMDEMIDEEALKEFLKEKERGMESMERFLQYDKPNKNLVEERITELGFRFVGISTLTLQKLLAKEFKTWEELNDFNFASRKEHGIVYRKIWNQNYKRNDYFIYCIFIKKESLNV